MKFLQLEGKCTILSQTSYSVGLRVSCKIYLLLQLAKICKPLFSELIH